MGKPRTVEGFWLGNPVRGSSGFAVDRELALFAGGYEDKANLFLVRPGEKRALKLDPIDENGQWVGRFSPFARGKRLFLQTKVALYSVDTP
jgi:hypothetical protein